jgi:hypothetical protein
LLAGRSQLTGLAAGEVALRAGGSPQIEESLQLQERLLQKYIGNRRQQVAGSKNHEYRKERTAVRVHFLGDVQWYLVKQIQAVTDNSRVGQEAVPEEPLNPLPRLNSATYTSETDAREVMENAIQRTW